MDDITVFPEMKTALRTYHPVPSLQKTDGNAQDAPRIKSCLKAALLPYETKVPPCTPDEVLQRLVRFSKFSFLNLAVHPIIEKWLPTTHECSQPHFCPCQPCGRMSSFFPEIIQKDHVESHQICITAIITRSF